VAINGSRKKCRLAFLPGVTQCPRVERPNVAPFKLFMDCRIRGFGACMIGGFPHRQEDSFFHQALERLRKETSHNLIGSVFTLGGFPVTRAPKHVASRCLSANPDIVVVQFATTDLVVPIRRRRRRDGSISSVSGRTSASTASTFDRLKWLFQGLIGDALRLAPVTHPEVYLDTMTGITRVLLERQVVPVVLSPFVFGGQRSDRIARDCAGRLKQALANVPHAVYVDAYAALSRHPHGRMLLSDGTHLSLEGQRVVAEALFPCLKNLMENQAWFPNRSPLPKKPHTDRAGVPAVLGVALRP
jgi:lysophospholipase L1-like esterase